jgi:hypothetical protein
MGFKRLLTPEKSLPSVAATLARLINDNFGDGISACTSDVFKSNAPFCRCLDSKF